MRKIALQPALSDAVEVMCGEIVHCLEDLRPTVYLYGSAVADDYCPGWSDIDLLVLARDSISQGQAARLVNLRQELQTARGDARYRLFEGGMLSLGAFLSKKEDRVVYWGTSGQRIAAKYDFNSLSLLQLLDSGILLAGEEARAQMRRPSGRELREDIARHYESIRAHAVQTDRSLYAYGWLLDIARCIYTLCTGRIIAKTAAGEWALAEGLCPCEEALRQAVAARRAPLAFLESAQAMDAAAALGPQVQAFADVLERELAKSAP